jgi:hypothetical protein
MERAKMTHQRLVSHDDPAIFVKPPKRMLYSYSDPVDIPRCRMSFFRDLIFNTKRTNDLDTFLCIIGFVCKNTLAAESNVPRCFVEHMLQAFTVTFVPWVKE